MNTQQNQHNDVRGDTIPMSLILVGIVLANRAGAPAPLSPDVPPMENQRSLRAFIEFQERRGARRRAGGRW